MYIDHKAGQDIREALEGTSPGIILSTNQIDKLQGESYSALTVRPDGQNIGMNINLNQLYELICRQAAALFFQNCRTKSRPSENVRRRNTARQNMSQSFKEGGQQE